jgi:hypothetical protein
MVLLVGYLRTESPRKKVLKPTAALKNSKCGKVALILGTGPSIDRLNVDEVPLYIDDIFAINEFFSLKISDRIIPNYYCLSDPAHFRATPEYSEERRTQLNKYLRKVEPSLLLPHWSYREIEFEHFCKLYFDDREFSWFRKNIAPTKPRSYSSATLYKALAMACHMGYDKIYILGLDNSNFKSYQGTVSNLVLDTLDHTAAVSDSHKEHIMPSPQVKFSSGMAGRMQSFSKLFGDLDLFPKSKIINLSQDSLVDVFRKIESHPLIN